MFVLRGNKLDIFGQITDAENTAVSRITGKKNRHSQTFGNKPVKSKKPGTVPRQMNTTLHDIGCQFRRSSFQHPANGFNNCFTGVFYRFIGLFRGKLNCAGGCIQLVDSAYMNGAGFVQGQGSSQILFDIFSGLTADEDIAFLAEIFRFRLDRRPAGRYRWQRQRAFQSETPAWHRPYGQLPSGLCG